MAKLDQKFHKNSKLKFEDEDKDDYQDFNQQERKRKRRLIRQRYDSPEYSDFADQKQKASGKTFSLSAKLICRLSCFLGASGGFIACSICITGNALLEVGAEQDSNNKATIIQTARLLKNLPKNRR